MDQSEAPLLDALVDYRKSNRYGFTPPGHRQGRGTDDRVLAVLGHDPFHDDVLASGGLDDRRTDAVIDYLRSGVDAGMNVPDAADTTLKTFRVVVT
jgi:hypothetical protein